MKDAKIFSPMVDEMMKWLDERYKGVVESIAHRDEEEAKWRSASLSALPVLLANKEVSERIDYYRSDRDTFACLINRIYRVPEEHYFRIQRDESGRHEAICVDVSKEDRIQNKPSNEEE